MASIALSIKLDKTKKNKQSYKSFTIHNGDISGYLPH